jgi:ATP-dependent DNA helicase RecG
MMEQLFISSVQKELQAERYAIRDFVHGNDLLRQFFRVFLFEDLPPADRRADAVYLDEVKNSAIYVGILGNEYGWQDDNGPSPTEREFAEATRLRKRRLILVKGHDDKHREPKMNALIQRVGDEVVRRRFENTDEMLRLLYGSLIQYLQDHGFVAAKDFDAVPCEDATLKDISTQKIRWFIEKARAERSYALAPDTPRKEALAHLNLLAKGKPTRGAILLFNEAPERFIRSADVTCLHFRGAVPRCARGDRQRSVPPRLCLQVRRASHGFRGPDRSMESGRFAGGSDGRYVEGAASLSSTQSSDL